jgi:hypothetical protein
LQQGLFRFDRQLDPNESYNQTESQPALAAELHAFDAAMHANPRGWPWPGSPYLVLQGFDPRRHLARRPS